MKAVEPTPPPRAARREPGRLPRWVWPVLALLPVLLLRLDWWTAFSSTPLFASPAIDEALHLDWARRLAAGAGSPEIPYFRAPLHAWWLGLLVRAGAGVATLRLAGLLCGLANLGLLLGLARRRLPSAALPWLLLLAGTSAAWIYFEPMLLIVHWLLLWLLISVGATLEAIEGGRRRWALLGGLAFGLAAISRPTALLLAPVLLWPGMAERGDLRRLWPRRALPWLLAAALPLGTVARINGWPASGVLVASQGGVNLWIGNNPQADGRSATLPGAGAAWERSDATAQAAAALGHRPTPGEESDWFARRAADWMRAEPGAAARLLLRKGAWLLAPGEGGSNTSPEALAEGAPLFGRWLRLGWWPLLLPGLAGLALGFPRHRELRRICWSGLLLYSGGLLLFFVNSRFRLPLLPLLALPAAELALAASRRLVWTARRTWRAGSEGAPPEPLELRPGRIRLLVALLALPLLAHLATRPADAATSRDAARGWQAFQLGNAWWRLQQPDSAEAEWRRAVELAPALPEARLNLALAASRRGDPAASERLLRDELAVDPTSAKAWTNLGALALDGERLPQAEAAFRRALRLRPGWPDADWNLGLVQCRLGLAALAAGDSESARQRLASADSTAYSGPARDRLARALATR